MSAPTEALAIALIADADIASVAALWQRCDLTRPWNDPSGDIAFARRGPNSAVLVGRHADAIVATVMVGHDGHRGWFYYLAVDPALQGRGFGRTMTQAAEAWLVGRGIAKAHLRHSPFFHTFVQLLSYRARFHQPVWRLYFPCIFVDIYKGVPQ